jgi:hypothetical protein
MMIMRLLAAAALLGALTGCANWTPNVSSDPMQNPSIYTELPADG